MKITPVEQQLRSECLNQAIRALPGMPASDIVEAAQVFLDFVTKEKTNEIARKKMQR